MIIEISISEFDIICNTIGKKITKTEYIVKRLLEVGIPVMEEFVTPYVKYGDINWCGDRWNTGDMHYLWKG